MRILRRKLPTVVNGPVWLAFTADWHVNSTIGLCAGPVLLDDGGIYQPSPEQRWLWSKWQEFWQEVGQLEGHRVAIVVGDAVESYHHGTVQIVTLNEGVELDMAEAVAQPVVDAVEECYVLRGTEAHSGGAGWKENQLAKRIGAVRDEQTGRFSWWHLAREFGGVKFDVAHHPRTMSHVPHTRDWSASRQATYTVADYDEDGIARPDVIVRGHAHYLGRGQHRDTFCLYLPPWLLTTAFGFRKGAGQRVEPVGGALFRCQGGEYTWTPRRYKVPKKAPW